VVPSVRQLVDADVRQPVEKITVSTALDHAPNDRADRFPRDTSRRRTTGPTSA